MTGRARPRRLGAREADINDRLGFFDAALWFVAGIFAAVAIRDVVVAGIVAGVVAAVVLALVVLLIFLGGGLPGDP